MSVRHRAVGRHVAPSAPRVSPALSRLPRLAVSGALSFGLVLGVAPLATAAPAAAATRTATVHKPTLHVGSRGADVKWVQAKLGVRPRSGYFGHLTKAAVTRFQRSHHLRATGSVDAATWRALGVGTKAQPARASRSSTRAVLPKGTQAVAVAAKYAGVRYRWGGTSPRTGFDCSGYVGFVYRQLGVNLPRTAAAMYSRAKKISAMQARIGDLVFVHKHGRITHVAIFAGNHMWWEATRPGHPTGKHKAWTTSVTYGRVL